ncbi:MAG: DUF983 domain-containing protein [Phenylobacterium sp.]|uniref:DUF983 domain-containing protein n=1 Tax=Phenylobacterium sp. TaxID=1871053 RepID=UPI0027324D15|nr:DUF983 domain-containing protein [Phenylobacterium sp.]MDP3747157.1 DUF983 domain-containing protein [Phenylobacterium sp.]
MNRLNPIVCGLRCRCPTCGQGSLFSGYLKVRPRCEGCGADFSRADSGDGPVVFILLIVGAIGCFGMLFVEFRFHPPVWLQLLIWLPSIGLLTLAVLRPFKAILIALQIHNGASEARHDN